MALALTLASPLALPAAPKELEGARAPSQTECPSPEEARKKMTVPEGYEVRCFAHEPMVQNPVAMTWDHRGRLWVVELYEYPEGTPLPVDKRPFGQPATDSNYRPVPEICKGEHQEAEGKIPRDRVLILEDTDNDGVADKRTVFLQGLDMACGIICGDGGVYIGQQPHLLHFKDNDGDDKPDEWRVVLTGFGREDTHELINSFSWGPDGWLYMTHGVFTNSKVRRPGEPAEKGFKFDAGIGRCKPLTGEFEVFADGTSNPWGCDFDANGNFFVSACVIDHLFHMAPGGLYVRQGGAPENPYAYELLPSIVKHKHFRAAYAGIQIYQGGVYPKDTHGHLFIGNIHDNAIHEEKVTPVGASFKAEPVRDFLRANDGWFRPVSTQTGPDGNLWIMDWCDKYPCYQNAKANPEGVDRARGRVWRVVYVGDKKDDTAKNIGSREMKDLDLKKVVRGDLVKLLSHSNSWMRRTATRMLVEDWRGEWSLTTIPSPSKWLTPLINDAKDPSQALTAAWAILSCGDVDPALINLLASSPYPQVRMWAARLHDEAPESAQRATVSRQPKSGGDELTYPVLDKLASDESAPVRAATAIAIRRSLGLNLCTDRQRDAFQRLMVDDPAQLPVFMGAAAHVRSLPALLEKSAAGDDKVLAFSIWQAMEPMVADSTATVLQMLEKSTPNSQPLSRNLVYKTMRRLCDTRSGEKLNIAISFCEKIQTHDSLLAHCLDGLVKGQESGTIKPTTDVTKQLAAWRKNDSADVRKQAEQLAVLWGDVEATNALIALAVNESTPTPECIQAIKTLRRVKTDAVRAGLAKLLGEKLPAAVSVEGIRAAADLGGDAFPPVLITLAASKDFSIRLAALEALSGRVDWAKQMLTAIEEKKVSGSEFPGPVRRALATNGDKAVRDQAFRVLGAWKESSADVKTLIETKKKAALSGTPDLEQGKLMFQATCAICHPFHGGGQKVGPDLIGSGRSNLDALLANVIDPNQIIGNGYENMIATTKDGRTLAGRLVEDTPSHIKLLAAGGAEQIVPRDQLAKLENTHQSLMPAGFGQLPDDQFRNLMWYVLAPPEEGPLTKEKKEMLSKGVEGGEAAKKSTGSIWHKPDWESVSLWDPKWKVSAPEFERTPVKLSDFHGRKNVLLMHPFTKDKPTVLERTLKLEAGKPHKLTAIVAAHDQGDWELRVKVNGKEVKKQAIDHDGERWKTVTVDLSEYAGQEVKIQLEGAATGWAWEFGYWAEVRLE